MHDGLPAAAYIVKVNADSIGLVDSLAYSSFSDGYDETGAGDAFHGGVGLVNNMGIPKPAFHAYRMLHALGNELLYNKDGIVVTRHKESNRLSAILYNLPAAIRTVPMGAADALFSVGEERAFNFKLTGTHPDARFNVEILDRDNGNALHAFKDAGSPESPAKDQVQTLQKMAMAVREEQILASTTGILQVGKSLKSWDVVLIEEVK
jgi:xylan 1,4-beta-xylosidase